VVFGGVQGQGVEISGRTKYFLPVHDGVPGVVFCGFVVHPRDKTIILRCSGFPVAIDDLDSHGTSTFISTLLDGISLSSPISQPST
jgi:hypothetical protein